MIIGGRVRQFFLVVNADMEWTLVTPTSVFHYWLPAACVWSNGSLNMSLQHLIVARCPGASCMGISSQHRIIVNNLSFSWNWTARLVKDFLHSGKASHHREIEDPWAAVGWAFWDFDLEPVTGCEKSPGYLWKKWVATQKLTFKIEWKL